MSSTGLPVMNRIELSRLLRTTKKMVKLEVVIIEKTTTIWVTVDKKELFSDLPNYKVENFEVDEKSHIIFITALSTQ